MIKAAARPPPSSSCHGRPPIVPRPKGHAVAMLFRIGFASVLASVALIAPASAGEISVRVHRSDDTLLRIGPYSFPGGKTLNLTVGIGSSAFRSPNDPSNVLWTLGDRGPNIECKDMKAIAGVELTCGEVKHGRVYPTPSYAPSIYRVLLPDDGSFRVTDVITLKDRDGRPLNGLPNPLRTASTETPLDGTEGDFAGAPYETKGSLPAIIAKRASNRGIEGIAISPDERFLYFIVQNPLANPDNAAYEKARNTRLFKLERGTMRQSPFGRRPSPLRSRPHRLRSPARPRSGRSAKPPAAKRLRGPRRRSAVPPVPPVAPRA